MIEESTDIHQPILDNKERSYATGKRKNSIVNKSSRTKFNIVKLQEISNNLKELLE